MVLWLLHPYAVDAITAIDILLWMVLWLLHPYAVDAITAIDILLWMVLWLLHPYAVDAITAIDAVDANNAIAGACQPFDQTSDGVYTWRISTPRPNDANDGTRRWPGSVSLTISGGWRCI